MTSIVTPMPLNKILYIFPWCYQETSNCFTMYWCSLPNINVLQLVRNVQHFKWENPLLKFSGWLTIVQFFGSCKQLCNFSEVYKPEMVSSVITGTSGYEIIKNLVEYVSRTLPLFLITVIIYFVNTCVL